MILKNKNYDMSTKSHSIEIKAPAAGPAKGTSHSLRTLIAAALDRELIVTQAGTVAREGTKSHGGIIKSVTLTFNFQEEGGE